MQSSGQGAPYRTGQPGIRFHHNRQACPVGQLIEPADRRYGAGGLPLCWFCEEITQTEPPAKGLPLRATARA